MESYGTSHDPKASAYYGRGILVPKYPCIYSVTTIIFMKMIMAYLLEIICECWLSFADKIGKCKLYIAC